MKFFARSKMRNFEANVAALRQRAERLGEKRAAAQVELERAVNARQTYAIEGDIGGADADADMARLQASVDSATSSVAGLDSALATITAQLAAAESELNAAKDRAAREAASSALAKGLDEIEPEIAAWMDQTRSLAGALEKHFGTVRHDAIPLGGFLLRACGEVELAASVLLPDLRGAIDRIREGTEKIPEAMAPPMPVLKVLPAPTTQVFLLRHCRWVDPETGKVELGQRFEDATLPAAIAQTALRVGAACPMSDPRRREYKGSWSEHRVSPASAFDLDAAAAETASSENASAAEPPSDDVAPAATFERPVLKHSAFEPLDRGAPYTLRVPREVPQ